MNGNDVVKDLAAEFDTSAAQVRIYLRRWAAKNGVEKKRNGRTRLWRLTDEQLASVRDYLREARS